MFADTLSDYSIKNSSAPATDECIFHLYKQTPQPENEKVGYVGEHDMPFVECKVSPDGG